MNNDILNMERNTHSPSTTLLCFVGQHAIIQVKVDSVHVAAENVPQPLKLSLI